MPWSLATSAVAWFSTVTRQNASQVRGSNWDRNVSQAPELGGPSGNAGHASPPSLSAGPVAGYRRLATMYGMD